MTSKIKIEMFVIVLVDVQGLTLHILPPPIQMLITLLKVIKTAHYETAYITLLIKWYLNFCVKDSFRPMRVYI
jgi:hypothetical protein